MDRRTKDSLRGAATALGVATGLLALATTAQTPDGYIHAGFGGPLDVFSGSNTADVLSIGDGANDASELAAILKGPVGPSARVGAADSPYRVAFEAGAAPNATTGAATLMPTSDPLVLAPGGKEPAILPSKPVVDSQGRIDCTGAVSCKTDPATNITTVTYPDGVIAVVQKINDLTVVAYKTLKEALPSEIATLLPPVPEAPPLLAAVAPTASSAPRSIPAPPSTVPYLPSPELPSSAPPTNVPVGEDEQAPVDKTPPTIEPPKIDLPAIDLPVKDTDKSGTGTTAPTPNLPNKVKDALGGIADTVKGALGSVGKALSPGASTKPEAPGPAGSAVQSGASDDSGDSGTSGGNAPSGSRADTNQGSSTSGK